MNKNKIPVFIFFRLSLVLFILQVVLPIIITSWFDNYRVRCHVYSLRYYVPLRGVIFVDGYRFFLHEKLTDTFYVVTTLNECILFTGKTFVTLAETLPLPLFIWMPSHSIPQVASRTTTIRRRLQSNYATSMWTLKKHNAVHYFYRWVVSVDSHELFSFGVYVHCVRSRDMTKKT